MKLPENERIDDLGRRGYRIIQNKTKFCFGVDAALLAWFTSVREGEKVIDLGTGTGIVPILMDARNACGSYTGLEIQPDMAEMATRSVLLNRIQDHVQIVEGDIKTASEKFGRGTFDVVTSNPPYMPASNGLVNPDTARAVSRHEILCNLDDVVREAAALLHPAGRFYMVHRPMRLAGILEKMKNYGLAPAELIFVHSFIDSEASMVLVSGIKGGRNMLKTGAPIILYKEPGVYTDRVRKIYDDDYRREEK